MNRHVSWLARVAASAAVRRLVYMLIALVVAGVLSLFGTGKAHAQDYSACYTNSTANERCPDRQVAYEQALRAATELHNGDVNYPVRVDGPTGWSSGRVYYQGVYRTGFGAKSLSRHWYASSECPAGNVWNDDIKECAPTECQDAPDYGNAMAASLYMCNNGCRYEQKTVGVSVCLGGAGDPIQCMGTWKPTGGACKANDKPPTPWDDQQETCRSTDETGSHSECVKPNGNHCVTSAKGAVLCWKPNEQGPRMTTDGTVGADRKIAPDTPTPPPNMKDPTQTTTTTTTINNTTYSTSTFTGTGNNGGQGNTGEGGKNVGGTGDPKGEGEGGDGEGGEDEDGAGDAGSGVGTLYEGEGKTLAGVYDNFKTQLEAAPLISSGTDFLTVSVSSSCPTFSVPETAFWSAMEFSYHCTGPLADALALGAYLLLAIAAYTAFKIGFG